jgi:hypothetical protein
MIISKLEHDFDWREAEIAHLKRIYVGTMLSSLARPTLLKCLVLLRYAHFEGFIRNCLNVLIDNINREKLLISQLKRPYSDIALEKFVTRLRTAMDCGKICDLLHFDDNAHMNEVANLQDFSGTTNLWPDQIVKMLNRIGASIPELSSYRSTIATLVNIRNDLAHGKSIRVKSFSDYENYESGALSVGLAIFFEVQGVLDGKNYLR